MMTVALLATLAGLAQAKWWLFQDEQGQKWIDPVTGMEFMWVPGGSFQMGCVSGSSECTRDEKNVHTVELDGFWLGTYEVTNAQYRQFKPDHDSKDYRGHSLNGSTQPAVYVSWDDATAFANWLTKQHGGQYTFRLPSEAEWEYAARAGTSTARFWGNDPSDACEYASVKDTTTGNAFDWSSELHDCNDGYAVTAPVGTFRPNAFGLYDMLGNVWEWCTDLYIQEPNVLRVVRGSSWYESAWSVRAAYRAGGAPIVSFLDLGFRLLRTPE